MDKILHKILHLIHNHHLAGSTSFKGMDEEEIIFLIWFLVYLGLFVFPTKKIPPCGDSSSPSCENKRG